MKLISYTVSTLALSAIVYGFGMLALGATEFVLIPGLDPLSLRLSVAGLILLLSGCVLLLLSLPFRTR